MLEINLTAFTTQMVAFGCLVVFMWKVVFPRLQGVIDERQNEITGTLEQIAADRRAMEQTRADYEQRLANIEAEAREHISGAVRQAQEEAAAIVAKSREEATAH